MVAKSLENWTDVVEPTGLRPGHVAFFVDPALLSEPSAWHLPSPPLRRRKIKRVEYLRLAVILRMVEADASPAPKPSAGDGECC
jgi:hypothetical protein